MSRFILFITGFIQVFLISINTWLISHGSIIGAASVGFIISITWTWNVKKVAFGNNYDRIIYSIGAAIGTLLGLLLAQWIMPTSMK